MARRYQEIETGDALLSMETVLITEGKAEGLVEKAFSPVRSAAWYSRIGDWDQKRITPW